MTEERRHFSLSVVYPAAEHQKFSWYIIIIIPAVAIE
jgi:hypothetical protein